MPSTHAPFEPHVKARVMTVDPKVLPHNDSDLKHGIGSREVLTTDDDLACEETTFCCIGPDCTDAIEQNQEDDQLLENAFNLSSHQLSHDVLLEDLVKHQHVIESRGHARAPNLSSTAVEDQFHAEESHVPFKSGSPIQRSGSQEAFHKPSGSHRSHERSISCPPQPMQNCTCPSLCIQLCCFRVK